MYDIELHIKPSDWLYILLTGMLFATTLSSLGYLLLELSWLHGLFFGAILGLMITLFSLISITFMNQRILPNVARSYWLLLAIFFSFVSGFFGTVLTLYMASFWHIQLVEAIAQNRLVVSTIVGVLTYVVGAMLYRFVRMRNQKDEIDQLYLRSRLNSLETQLNSHFLFNALNSIAELIHEDANRAEEMTLKVSQFLRNTMNEKAMVPFHEELKNTIAYVELENIRFSQRIALACSDEQAHFMVPKFSLQLLVENAIKHGMVEQEPLRIDIEVDRQTQQVRVSNSGTPMHSYEFGVGLSNLNERMRILVGGELRVFALNPPTFILQAGV